MERFQIIGGRALEGVVKISGAKNAAVAIIPAVILADAPCRIENLPRIDDVFLLQDILVQLGAHVEFEENTMLIDGTQIKTHKADFELVSFMRASYYLLGAMLGRFGKAEVSLPGGCEIGERPMDLHEKGFRALGATVKREGGVLKVDAPHGLCGANIFLDFASVGATINIMLAAVRATGITVISNAAKEPHVVDVANFLNFIGASVKGAGTSTIKIQGKSKLGSCTYSVIPDQIEAGTYMIAAAATGGDIILKNIIPSHLDALSIKFAEMGIKVDTGDDGHEFFLRVISERPRPRGTSIKTMPYPGFPTDLQQPMMSLLTCCEYSSVVVETVFEDRFKHVGCLKRMGANISVDGRIAVIESVDKLHGATVASSDLRAGAALIIAALMAEGRSDITHINYIDRGYEQIEQKLTALGAKMLRINEGRRGAKNS